MDLQSVIHADVTILMVLLVSLFFSTSVAGVEPLSFPTPTTTLSGETVLFNCTIEEPGDEVNILEWYIHWDTYSLLKVDAQAEGMMNVSIPGHGDYRRQYRVTTKEDGSKIHFCTLNITDVTPADTGYFGCTHRIENNNFRTLLADKVKLVVWKLPDDELPLCTQSEVTGTDFVTLTCSFTGGIPPTSLSWYNYADTMISTAQNHSVVSYISRTETTRQYTCKGTHPAFTQPQTCSIIVARLTTPTSLFTTTGVTIESNTIENNTLTITSMNSKPSTGTQTMLPPKLAPEDSNFIIPIIIAVSSAALFIFLLLIILFSLLCRRKNKKTLTPSYTPPQEIQELPVLENRGTEAAAENPYAELGRAPLPPRPPSPPGSEDNEEATLKPWKYHPELLDMLANVNSGYEGDDAAGASGGYMLPSSSQGTSRNHEGGHSPRPPPSSSEGTLKKYDPGNIYATRL